MDQKTQNQATKDQQQKHILPIVKQGLTLSISDNTQSKEKWKAFFKNAATVSTAKDSISLRGSRQQATKDLNLVIRELNDRRDRLPQKLQVMLDRHFPQKTPVDADVESTQSNAR